jgi:hypothetical protein
MKQLVSCFLFFLTISAYAQPYRPMPLGPNTTWRIHFFGMDELGPCTCTSEYMYVTDGDTIIGAHQYTKIKLEGIPACWCNQAIRVEGVIRQDSVARKVFIVLPGDSTEQILYDFTQQVGDQVNSILYPAPPSCPPSTISAIDSILINGQYHRQLHIQPNGCTSFTIQFIEGIGSTGGLLEQLIINYEIWPTLECVTSNGVTRYPDASFNCDTTFNSIPQIENIENSYSVYPNPAQQQVLLHAPAGNTQVTIYNTSFQKIKELLFINSNISVDIANYPSGLYFVVFGSHHSTVVKKLIIE